MKVTVYVAISSRSLNPQAIWSQMEQFPLHIENPPRGKGKRAP